MVFVFRAAALVPSPPLLVPELTGSSAAETADLRCAALDAVTELTSKVDRWIAIGVDRAEETYDASTVGTFRGFGVDVVVRLSDRPSSTLPDPELPLSVLIAGWLRGNTDPDSPVEVRIIPADASSQQCTELGAELRRELDASPESWGILVLADGANTLTAKAPGSFDDRAEAIQQRIDDALAAADVDSLASLDADLCAAVGVSGRAVWQVLAAAVGSDTIATTELYRLAPFGVGYYVGTWSRV